MILFIRIQLSNILSKKKRKTNNGNEISTTFNDTENVEAKKIEKTEKSQLNEHNCDDDESNYTDLDVCDEKKDDGEGDRENCQNLNKCNPNN